MADDERNTVEDEQSQQGETETSQDEIDVDALTESITAKVSEQLEAKYKAEIAGRDRKIAELQTQRMSEGERREAELKETRDLILEEKALRVKAENRGIARDLLTEAGIKGTPQILDDLVKSDAEQTKESVSRYIEDRKAARAEWEREHDAANGRTVTGPRKVEGLTWDKLSQMSDAELLTVPPELVAKITQEAAKH